VFSRRQALIIAAVAALIAATPPMLARSTWAPIARLDTDHDGVVDLSEVKKAAADLFDRLDTDKDGRATIKEVRGRLSRREFAAADPNHDGVLTRNEYFVLVAKRLKAVDPDDSGAVSATDFSTPSGRALLRLLR